MSEIVVANVFFSSDKQTGLVGGTPNTFSIIAGNTTSLIANSAGITLNNVSFSSNSSVSVGNSSVSISIAYSDSYSLLMGYYANAFATNMNIGSMQLYNRALSATEVMQNFNAMRERYNI